MLLADPTHFDIMIGVRQIMALPSMVATGMVPGAQAAAEELHGIAVAAVAVIMVGEPLGVGGLIAVVDDES